AVFRTRTVVPLQDVSFLRSGKLRRVIRIEAHRHHVEFFANVELQNLERAFQSNEQLRAQHGTAVINEIKNDRLLANVVAQLHRLSAFVAESQVQGDLLLKALINPDI